MDGTKVQEATGPIAVTVDVIIADPATNLQWVSLECEVVPGSTPTPHIQWIRTDTGGDIPEILTEDFVSNTVRFIDGGQWLILETTEAAVIGKEYYCQVTNKQIFQTVRGPITYTLNPGEPLSSAWCKSMWDYIFVKVSQNMLSMLLHGLALHYVPTHLQ